MAFQTHGSEPVRPPRNPGVHIEERVPEAPARWRTGVPLFIGFAAGTAAPRTLTRWQQFPTRFGPVPTAGLLAHAVRGFFYNGGERCLVYPLPPEWASPEALAHTFSRRGPLQRLFREDGPLDDVEQTDLVCLPDLMLRATVPADVFRAQGLVLEYCRRMGERFAILDAVPGIPEQVLAQRAALLSKFGALYYPRPLVEPIGGGTGLRPVPPCGHVAGVYARSDRRQGVHKAPANEPLKGALDLERALSAAETGRLNDAGVNCLCSIPGRGVRVWGARTLSGQPAWRYVNVRRLFLDLVRWAEYGMRHLVFEPNSAPLWRRVGDRLRAHCLALHRRGALKGRTPGEAFFVKCDGETNSTETRAAGQIVAEVGLAVELPAEFVVVRLVRSAAGSTTLIG
jgi:hypothetical protein